MERIERSAKECIEEHLRDVKNQSDKPILRYFIRHVVGDVWFVLLLNAYEVSFILKFEMLNQLYMSLCSGIDLK